MLRKATKNLALTLQKLSGLFELMAFKQPRLQIQLKEIPGSGSTL